MKIQTGRLETIENANIKKKVLLFYSCWMNKLFETTLGLNNLNDWAYYL